MANVCTVKGCDAKVSKQEKTKLYRFPKPKKSSLNLKNNWLLEQRRKCWYNAIKRKDLKLDELDSKRICAKHFVTGTPADFLDIENPDWTPSLHLGRRTRKKTFSTTILNKWEKMDDLYVKGLNQLSELQRSRWKFRANIMNISSNYPTVTESANNSNVENSEDMPDGAIISCEIVSVNKEPLIPKSSTEDMNKHTPSVNALMAEVQTRTEEALQLRKEISVLRLDREAFQSDNEKVKYYTGLSDLAAVLSILEQIERYLLPAKGTTLSNFQKLMLTLIKLRLNICFRDLAYRFNIDSKLARKVFKHVVSVMYERYKDSIQWPDRESLAANTPICLQENLKNPDCGTAMIDFFEIPVESPNTSSENTQKYLLSFTPFGDTIFISKGYDGQKTHNNFIVKDSGILSRLLPGDLIIADRGATVKKLVPMRKGQVKTSVLKCPNLDTVDITDIEDMNGVRKVIEHRIDEIYERYKIFHGPASVPLLRSKCGKESFLDCILHVTCVLVNLCD